MLAGAFRDRVMVQLRTRSSKATGIDEAWANVRVYWVRVIPLSARALAEYAQTRSEVTHEVEFRGRVELNFENRLVWLTGSNRMLKIVEPPFYAEGKNAHTRIGVRQVI